MGGPRSVRGFTLVELILVVAILATIAGGVLVSLEGVEDRAIDGVNRHEMVELRNAVLAFQRDTGYLPKQGPFALDGTTVGARARRNADPSDDVRENEWFAHPANWDQLLTRFSPLPTGDPLEVWNADRRRGWRGPYVNPGLAPAVAEWPDSTGVVMPEMPSVLDAWRRSYWLEPTRIRCLGPDGLPLTPDDIELPL